MEDHLSISIVQPTLHWHDAPANFDTIGKLVSQVDSDLIVLPEMWSSGFTMKAHQAHVHCEEALSLMHAWASEKQALVCGSLITKVEDVYYNRMYCISPDGLLKTYDKKHLFAYAGEDRYYVQGEKREEIDWKGYTLRLNICYDLRFPVWSRNDTDYDVLLYSANWPSPRIDAWDALLKARAIENQCFTIGANCVGRDAWSNDYVGHSAVIKYDGSTLAFSDKEGIVTASISKRAMLAFRDKLPFLRDRDPFTL